MEEDTHNNFSQVLKEESGQKLLQFLERRLHLPSTLIHRWIRTGQIRLNGKRAKPFDRILTNDIVRLPPFALKLALETIHESQPEISSQPDLPPVIYEKNGIIAFNKPQGLPTHPGSGHSDSLESRVRHFFSDRMFIPAPCHRLDRDTSGILLFGTSFEALSRVQGYFRDKVVHKEYLAVVQGEWIWNYPVLLKHFLRKEGSTGKVKVRASTFPVPYGREALTIIQPIKVENGNTLLQIRLLTGRTHQIRSQLSRIGFPVIGDGKYSNIGGNLKLHAFRILLPEQEEICCLPAWKEINAEMPLPPILPEASYEEMMRLPVITEGDNLE